MKIKLHYALIYFAIMMVMANCQKPKEMVADTAAEAHPTVDYNNPVMSFITFKIIKNIENDPTVKIVNQAILNGEFKNVAPNVRTNKQLIIEIISGNVEASRIIIDHPLYELVETSHGGELHTSIVNHDEKEFFIRTIWQKNNFIRIYEKINNKETLIYTSKKGL
jgi:hypothetical protein